MHWIWGRISHTITISTSLSDTTRTGKEEKPERITPQQTQNSKTKNKTTAYTTA
jgi:hypothetical protein